MLKRKLSTATDTLVAQGSSEAWTELSGRDKINIPASSCLAHLVLSLVAWASSFELSPFIAPNLMLEVAK